MIISRQAAAVSQNISTDLEIICIFCAWNLLTMATQHENALWFSTENKALPEGYEKLRKAKNKKNP